VIVAYLFFALFVGLISYTVYFQVVLREDYLSSPYNKRQDANEEEIVRGSILAADGTPLARTVVDEEGGETREYPYGRLFAQVVGYSDYGTSGLESTENYALLSTHADLTEQLKNDLKGRKNKGDNVVTSLDVDLQQAASDALGDNRGAVFVMDVSTGRVLADVSKPDFDPNTVSEDWEELNTEGSGSPFLNRALQGLYPPGSTFKIVTSLAYLRQYGTLDNYSFDCTGEYTQGGFTIHCSGNTAHGHQTFAQAFANSCNCAFSQMATELLDSRALMETADSLNFNKKLSLDLPSMASSFTLENAVADGLTMQTAIGQGDTLATPALMAMIAGAVANDGEMMKPTFVERLENYTGTWSEQEAPQSLGSVMSANEAAQLRELMKGVVRGGTGSGLADLPYDIAGKTGTAEYGNTEESNAHSWFVGFSNTGNADIAVAVIVEGGGYGSTAAVPVARAVFESYFR
jgi:peptidoglycan glycosyltransferase